MMMKDFNINSKGSKTEKIANKESKKVCECKQNLLVSSVSGKKNLKTIRKKARTVPSTLDRMFHYV